MTADALANATDTKACVVGPGAADGAAAMFRELFPSAAKAIIIEDPRTKSVAGDNVSSRLRGAGIEVSEYVVNPDGSDFHATYEKVEEVREAIRGNRERGMGNRERGMGNGEWGMGNGELSRPMIY
jgi:glycerol dehydrogenase-like iron-containing ADH family enzyme